MEKSTRELTYSWYDINANSEHALLDDFKFPPEPLVQKSWRYSADQIFKQEWIDQFEDKGIYLKGLIMLFYKAPYLKSNRAHWDIDSIGTTTWAMNWTFNNTTSYMTWYDDPGEDADEYHPDLNDYGYREWDTRQLVEIDRKQINSGMVLCRTDKPHAIECGSEGRWAISVRAWLGPRFPDMPTWETVVDKFKQLNLIVDR